ncbi:biotin/lipoyl-binding protein, partial [Bacillus licheniformis]|uniref:biotin/lipoyl-binding protein n=1 Tax=Bacillus licheniformis TaxID=1402 RepID=UPI00237D1832
GIAFGVKRYNGSDKQEVTSVRVEPVSRGDLVEIVSAPGQVQPKTKVQISARVAAPIRELPLDEGAQVKAGDVLIRLDATELEAQLRATQARASGQKAQLEEAGARVKAQEATIAASRVMLMDAQRDLQRQKQLLASADVSQAIVDTAQAKAD